MPDTNYVNGPSTATVYMYFYQDIRISAEMFAMNFYHSTQVVQFGGRLSADFKKSLIDSVRNKSTELQEVQTTVDNAQVVSKTVNEDCEKSVRRTGKPTYNPRDSAYVTRKSIPKSGATIAKAILICSSLCAAKEHLVYSQSLRLCAVSRLSNLNHK